jgi:hypothetical protein
MANIRKRRQSGELARQVAKMDLIARTAPDSQRLSKLATGLGVNKPMGKPRRRRPRAPGY